MKILVGLDRYSMDTITTGSIRVRDTTIIKTMEKTSSNQSINIYKGILKKRGGGIKRQAKNKDANGGEWTAEGQKGPNDAANGNDGRLDPGDFIRVPERTRERRSAGWWHWKPKCKREVEGNHRRVALKVADSIETLAIEGPTRSSLTDVAVLLLNDVSA